MKKLFCLLMVMLLCAGTAMADDCDHLFQIDIEGGCYDSGWFSVGDLGHVWRDYYWQTCDYCGLRTLMYFEDQLRDHHYSITADWHMNGETVHHYEAVCTTCGYETYYTRGCNDEDCIKIIVKPRSQ